MKFCFKSDKTNTLVESLPPGYKHSPEQLVIHGDVLIDDFAGLNNLADELAAHLIARERDYFDACIANLLPQTEQIETALSRISGPSSYKLSPVRRGSWWYFILQNAQHPRGVLCRAAREPKLFDSAQDQIPTAISTLPDFEILVDDDAEAELSDYYSRSNGDISADGSVIAYSISRAGNERYTIYFKGSESGWKDKLDVIEDCASYVVISRNNRVAYYIALDSANRPFELRQRILGSWGSEDSALFTEKDASYWLSLHPTRSGQFAVLQIRSKTTSEIWLIDLGKNGETLSLVWAREEGVSYSVDLVQVGNEMRIAVLHNRRHENKELTICDLLHPTSTHKQLTILEPSDTRELLSIRAHRDFVAIQYREDARLRVGAVKTADHLERANILLHPEFSGSSMTEVLAEEYAWDSASIKIDRSSYITPGRLWCWSPLSSDLKPLDNTAIATQKYIHFRQETEWAVAADGTKIPMTILYRTGSNDLTFKRPRPTIVHAYGAYGVSLDAHFSEQIGFLLDLGVIYVVAHVRGGGELGPAWHKAGSGKNKLVGLTDLERCVHYLHQSGWSDPLATVGYGSSAGGVLFAGVTNMFPKLFSGIALEAPFLDPLQALLDKNAPLTANDWGEWGNPLDDVLTYEAIKSYSPYQNIGKHDYPPFLITVSPEDPRIPLGQVLRWCAQMRENGQEVLLNIRDSGGHFGSSEGKERLREAANLYAWMLKVMGLS